MQTQKTDREAAARGLSLLWRLSSAVECLLASCPDRGGAVKVILAEASQKIEEILREEANNAAAQGVMVYPNKPWNWMREMADGLQRLRLLCATPSSTPPTPASP